MSIRVAAERSLTLNVSATTVAAGSQVTFSGKLSASPKGSPVLIERTSGKRWQRVAATKTSSKKGTYSATVTLTVPGTQTFRARAPKKGKRAQAVSAKRRVLITPSASTPTPTPSPQPTPTVTQTPTTPAPTTPTPVSAPTLLASGYRHTCSIGGGALYCWGSNNYGELGDGTTTDRSTPTRVSVSSDWTTISTGDGHTCGIRGGATYCWGWNDDGQLGDGNAFSTTPRTVLFPA